MQEPQYKRKFRVKYEMIIIFDDELKKELCCYMRKSMISFYITQHEDCFAPVKFTDQAAATHKERLVMAISSSLSQKMRTVRFVTCS